MRFAPSPRSARLNELGFSAAEMLVVVAIIGMMVLITTPSMINFWNSMKVRTSANALMSHMRLCRQAAVSRRTTVLLELQRTNGSTRPTYKAWEERNGNLQRDPNGADGTVNTADDENWVVRAVNTIATNGVKFSDSYNDITPNDATDDPGSSIMNSSGIMRLKFFPNGTVVRMTDANAEVSTDTQIRMRLRRKITASRVDQWDVTVNRVGKVGYNFNRTAPPE